MIVVKVALNLDGTEDVASIELFGALIDHLQGASFYTTTLKGRTVSIVIDSAHVTGGPLYQDEAA